MNLTFFRSQTVGVKVGKPEESRAFVFDVAFGVAGVSGEVDPLSGMAVSLVAVDRQLDSLRDYLSAKLWSSLEEALVASIDWLNMGNLAENLILKELLFTEKRGLIFGWSGDQYFMGRRDFVELSGDLYRLRSKFVFDEQRLSELPSLESKADIESGKVFADQPELISIEIEDFVRGVRFQYFRSSLDVLAQKNLGIARQK